MYKIKIYNFKKIYLLEELIKVFLRPDEYRILDVDEEAEDEDNLITINENNFPDRNKIKQEIYDKLTAATGLKPEWGILTGIRPVKLCGEKYNDEFNKTSDKELARCNTIDWLTSYYYLQPDKAELVMNMYEYQLEKTGRVSYDSAGIYIGIPFCPTRCVYCSFASNQVPDEEIARYLEALHKEIEWVGEHLKNIKMFPESIYIGGGTPTTLNAIQLEDLILHIKDCFDFSKVKEFTVEAGRPDTISINKLKVLKNCGVQRISINPQSMKDSTLNIIGRNHSVQDIRDAFTIANMIGFESINADIIAGLPEETVEDFKKTLEEVICLGADNITVHSLAVKRASRLKDIDKDYHYKKAQTVSLMLDASRDILKRAGYTPYYLYRQKHMAGAYENTGYCKKDKECIYNIRIMDEHQSIIALGAGGITKVYNHTQKKLTRVPNVTNYQEYISRVDEMLSRKEKELFRRY